MENLSFIRNNFWSNVDLNDDALWNGPTMYDYLNEYLYSIVSPEPDSIAFAASEVAKR